MNLAGGLGTPNRIVQSLLVDLVVLFACEISAAQVVVIGATKGQEHVISCIVESAGEQLTKTATGETPLVFIILEHRVFLEARRRFRAFQAEHAFSSLASRRIYLSSRAFVDSETALKYIAHELGHFATDSLFERNAELRAAAIKRKARPACGLLAN